CKLLQFLKFLQLLRSFQQLWQVLLLFFLKNISKFNKSKQRRRTHKISWPPLKCHHHKDSDKFLALLKTCIQHTESTLQLKWPHTYKAQAYVTLTTELRSMLYI